MQLFLILTCAVVLASSASELELNRWLEFKRSFNKSYESADEENRRMEIFFSGLREIEEHNKNFNNDTVPYMKGVNQFSDMTDEELEKSMGCLQANDEEDEDVEIFDESLDMELPRHVDWRRKGVVTHVKDQGQCGSCWAFSATGALEGQFSKKHSRLVSVSEQNLVDCSKRDKGCKGGRINSAFKYVKNNRGIDSEHWYPYRGVQGRCRYNRRHSVGTIKGYMKVRAGNERALMAAVAHRGPVSVAIHALGVFRYHNGIFNDRHCKSGIQYLNHAVLVVGYGTTKNGNDYWIVKNSWGKHFGEGGYIYMSRNKHNQCGIATDAYFPVV